MPGLFENTLQICFIQLVSFSLISFQMKLSKAYLLLILVKILLYALFHFKRFNSNILQKSYPGSPKTQQYCCCAIGSRDRSLSVWLTSLKRPLVVIHDLFTSSVLDLSWSSSGLHLLACSWDGTVTCIEFTTEEIGKPLSMGEKVSTSF